jgi:hypothetical protein
MTIIGLHNGHRFHYANDNNPAYVVIYRQRSDGNAEWVATFNTMFPDGRKEAYAFAQRLKAAPHFEEILILETDRSDWPAELADVEQRAHRRALEELAASFHSTEKEYRGIFDDRGEPQIVVVDQNGGYLLRHYVRHSPTGLFWGYSGSGPAETARCILADALGLEPLGDTRPIPFPLDPTSIPEIDGIYQMFKRDVIAHLPRNEEWTLPLTRVQAFLDEHPPRRVCPIHREPEDHQHECESCTEERIAQAEEQD